MINLLEVINQLHYKIDCLQRDKDEKIKQIELSCDEEINKYKQALEVNLELNEVCWKCEGKGTVRYDEYGNRWSENCPQCGGSGKKE